MRPKYIILSENGFVTIISEKASHCFSITSPWETADFRNNPIQNDINRALIWIEENHDRNEPLVEETDVELRISQKLAAAIAETDEYKRYAHVSQDLLSSII